MRGALPPITVFERLKLPKQIIYRRKGNLSESLNHFNYRENILISRFYEQFSRSSWIYALCGSTKNFKLLEHKHIMYHSEAGGLEIPNIQFVLRKSQISRFYESI